MELIQEISLSTPIPDVSSLVEDYRNHVIESLIDNNQPYGITTAGFTDNEILFAFREKISKEWNIPVMKLVADILVADADSCSWHSDAPLLSRFTEETYVCLLTPAKEPQTLSLKKTARAKDIETKVMEPEKFYKFKRTLPHNFTPKQTLNFFLVIDELNQ